MKRKILTLAAIAGLAGGFHAGNNHIVENTTYQGTVTSFGKKGAIWQTYEGLFAIGGEQRSQTGYFSLDAQARNGENVEELAAKLYDAAETGKTVTVTGTRSLFCYPWRSGANYHVSGVEYTQGQ